MRFQNKCGSHLVGFDWLKQINVEMRMTGDGKARIHKFKNENQIYQVTDKQIIQSSVSPPTLLDCRISSWWWVVSRSRRFNKPKGKDARAFTFVVARCSASSCLKDAYGQDPTSPTAALNTIAEWLLFTLLLASVRTFKNTHHHEVPCRPCRPFGFHLRLRGSPST